MKKDIFDLSCCRLCPRECGVDRLAGERGFCGMGAALEAARAGLHFWEEPCLSGREGSGTVFFSGCSLGCIYCQNREISREKKGFAVSEERLAEIFLALQAQGANNINLVTAAHFLPPVREALLAAKERGLRIPVVYNSGGYEQPEALKRMEGLIDIYLPDYKTVSRELAAKYSRCPDYPEKAMEALREMVRQCGEPAFDGRGMMTRGVIVRHLLLPGCAGDSKRTLRALRDAFGDRIYISILRQYTPMPWIGAEAPELNRAVTEEEYDRVVDFALRIGITLGFMQEGESAAESFIPAFDGEGILP